MSKKDIIRWINSYPVVAKKTTRDSGKNAISFTGSAIQHPNEEDKFILITDPISDHPRFIEFYKKDMVMIEEMPSISTETGENVKISQVWIRRGSHAIRYEPFIVEDTRNILFKKLENSKKNKELG